MKHSIFLLVSLLCFPQARAQQHTGTIVPSQSGERFVSYADTKANRLLFDTTDPHGFYRVLPLTIDHAARTRCFDLHGITTKDLAAIKKQTNYKIGEQSIIPLMNREGNDSVIYHPDGIEEYVYPPRDTIWQDLKWRILQATEPLKRADGTDSVLHLPDGTVEYIYPMWEKQFYTYRGYDEVVIREQLETDPLTGKQVYVPVEVFLRRNSRVTLRFDFALFAAWSKKMLLAEGAKRPSFFAWEKALAEHTLAYSLVDAPK